MEKNKVISNNTLIIVLVLVAFVSFYGLILTMETTPRQPRMKAVAYRKLNTSRAHAASTPIKQNRSTLTERKLVLFYTGFFGDMSWSFLSERVMNKLNEEPCPYKCRVTSDKKLFANSSAVIFHARDMPSVTTLNDLMRKKPVTQVWVYFIMENPINTPPPSQFNNMFNWTMTYSSKSDVFFPYGQYYASPSPSIADDFTQGKDKLIVWGVSHCGKLRDSVAKKLSEYLPVNIYGGCASRFPKRTQDGTTCPRFNQECDALMLRFKFALSFENEECPDYTTEKYWFAIQRGNLPIVLGGINDNVAIPGSYIHIKDFPNIKALSEYIKYLDKNHTAYNQYFQWKRKYKVNANAFSYTRAGCNLCSLLNTRKSPKVYEHLDRFWDRGMCNRESEKLLNIISG